MSKFITELDASVVKGRANGGRGTWRLDDDLVYQSDVAQQTFKVPAGFMTDFASVPRLPVIFLLFGDSSHEAAVLHDWLYTAKPVDRAMADKIFREACEITGVPWWRRWGQWAGVRMGGWGSWSDDAAA
jgi:hypothetical protein